jgi:hypothetical protein
MFFILVIAGLLISGCGTWSKKEQPAKNDFFTLDEQTSLGQSFLSRYDGLSGISIYINLAQANNGLLRLDLYEKFGEITPIRSTESILAESHKPTYLSLDYSPINNSATEDFYYELSYEGSGSISVAGAAGNRYLNGAIYIDGQPQNSQMAFNLEYSPMLLSIGLFIESLTWLGILAVGFFIVGIPGWAILSWFFPPWGKINWISKFALSLVVGIALYPLIILWSEVFSLQLGPWFAWFFPSLCLALIVWRKYHNYQKRDLDLAGQDAGKGKIWQGKNFKQNVINFLPDLAFIIIVGFLIITRFWPIRSLDAAMWGDSYQHTLITQLIVDNGGLFRSWQPYTELSSFTYHFGFHSIAAVYHWLTRIDVTQATLWVGQLLNIFAVITLYPLAVLIGKNRWAGVIALLIAGLIAPMPMSYTNWGRFTQLAGQVILPALIVILWMNLKTKRIHWKWNSLIWITLAGLFLSHYRVVLFIPFFYLSVLILDFRAAGWTHIIKLAALHAFGSVLLVLPWLLRLVEGKLPEIYGNQIQVPASQVSQAIQDYNAIGDITGFLPNYLWIMMILAVAWGIIQRNRDSNIFSLWWLFILLAANPNWLRLPGAGILSNFAVFIAAYIPVGIIIGSAAGSILNELRLKKKNENGWYAPIVVNSDNEQRFAVLSGIALLVVLIIGLINFRSQLSLVKPSVHSLVTRPDVKAGYWIDENLPGDAKLLVNSFFAYGGSLVVGSDAGWWLPILAARETTLPPINYGFENGPEPDYVETINELVAEIEAKGISHPDVLAELQDQGITHIFIGQQQGKVNVLTPLINVNDLVNNPNFGIVYNQDRVKIFEIMNPEG